MKNKDPLTILFSKKAGLIQTVKHGELILNDNGSFLYKNIDSSKENDSFSYVINTDYGISDTLNVNLIRKDLSIESFASIYYDFDKSDFVEIAETEPIMELNFTLLNFLIILLYLSALIVDVIG